MSSNEAVLIDVLPAHAFDEGRLAAWLADTLSNFDGALAVRQFQGGQSNPTFLLETGGKKYVLRKKPPGKLLPSAHQVEREYKIISALAGSGVPVPRTLALCEETDVVGTAFYVMEYVDGRVFDHQQLPDQTPNDRAAIFNAMNKAMAALHSVDWTNAGLSDFGRPENYLERQIARWSKQYRASVENRPIDVMEPLIEWLSANIPQESWVTIAHGDFRLGNLLYDPKGTDVLAVLDWELSTLGDPLGDLAYCCLPYHLTAVQEGTRGLKGLDLEALGIPTEEAFLASYCERTGRERIENWTFYLAFSLFRLASILQGVYARAIQGNASSANGLAMGERAVMYAQTAWSLIEAREGE